MLSLLDPVQIDNLALFRDDEDPRKFYVLPDVPAISTDEQGNPDFYFIHYIRDVSTAADTATNDDLAGGYVQFRTALELSDDRRAKLVAALKAQLTQELQAGKKPFGNPITSTDPLLASPLWTKGTVRLETFKVGDKELVRADTDNVPVDLAGGELGAAVTLTLSSDGAEVFWASFQSFKDQQIPIVIRYDLSYQARVAANMTIHVDRTTVISQVWKLAQPKPMRYVPANRRWLPYPYTGAFTPAALQQIQLVDPTVAAVARWSDVRDAIHSSVTSGTIEVKVDIGEGAGGTDNKVQEMLFTLATDLLTNKVVPSIFGDPVADPSAGDASSGSTDPNKPTDAMLKMPPSDSTNTTENKFDMTFTSTDVIEQTCSPNAPVHLMIDDPAKLAACFKELRIADGFFSLLRVAASTAGVNFAQDGLNAVHVYLDYDEIDEGSPDKPRVHRSTDFTLKSESDVVRWKCDTARDANGGHKTGYKFRTDVYYGDVVVRSKPTDWIPATDQMLQVTPAHMGVVRVQLQYTARRDQVQSARVRLTATNKAGERLVDTFELSADAPAKTWLRPTGDLATSQLHAAPQQYAYQITYVVNNNEIAMPEQTSTSDGLTIPGPFTRQLQYLIMPRGSFDGVSSISGTATYTDPSSGYTVMKEFQLVSLTTNVLFVVPAMPGGPDTITVAATIDHADGSSTALDTFTASPGEVKVGIDVARFLEIKVIPTTLNFDTDVQLAIVQLAYSNSAQGDVSTTLTFDKTTKTPQTWRVPLRADGALDYDVDIQYVAYDRSKNSEVHEHPHANKSLGAVLLLDRSAK